MSLPVVLEPGSSWGTRFTTYRSALAAAQKPGAGVPAYMRWVNRGAARVVAAACAAFGWTPNFVSFISVCFSTLGLIVLVALERRLPPRVCLRPAARTNCSARIWLMN